ncbi:hypothetical protein V8E36_001209 [Tilletia maclaganii]
MAIRALTDTAFLYSLPTPSTNQDNGQDRRSPDLACRHTSALCFYNPGSSCSGRPCRQARHCFDRAENIHLNPIWAVVALLVDRHAGPRGMRRACSTRRHPSFHPLAGSQFVGIGPVPVLQTMDKSMHLTGKPLVPTFAGQMLQFHAKQLSLSHLTLILVCAAIDVESEER